MIRHIKGTLAAIDIGRLVVDVSGIGYLINVSKVPTATALNQPIGFHTHLVVRENVLDLYGFSTLDELEIFEILLTLPKIGPKSALQILTQADVELLKKAVLNTDPTYLSKMSGIGKKTAEKIVHELKDVFSERFDMSHAIGPNFSSGTSDTIDALVSLGYNLQDAREVVKNISPELNTNDALKEALKHLSR
jgi:holliday junction DNA helicase RuvA